MKIKTLVLSALFVLVPQIALAAHWEATLNEPNCLNPEYIQGHKDSCSVASIGKELNLSGVYKDPDGNFDMSVNFWVPSNKQGFVKAIPDTPETLVFTKTISLTYDSPYCTKTAGEGRQHVAITLGDLPVAAIKDCDLASGHTILTVTDPEVIEKVIKEMKDNAATFHVMWKDDIGFKLYVPATGFDGVYSKDSSLKDTFQHAAMMLHEGGNQH